jgi:O-glycosyl hydrolase
MKHKLTSLLAIATAIVCGSCSSSQDAKDSNGQTTSVTLNIEDGTTYQTVEHFGASDAWSCQFAGNWPDAKRNAIADLLFSQDMDETGSPKGIGLSLWRFNMGAGSAEQGTGSGIGDEWRRAESFLKADGTYDWAKQQGQVWFAQAAKQRGVANLLLFPNSPPVSLTRNGKAFSASATQTNLTTDNIDDFAAYLASVAEGMQNLGLAPNYISPVNEPQWDWTDGGQEGTPFFNNEIAQLATSLNQKLDQKGLTTKIDLAEAGQINYLYEVGNRPGRSDQIKDFFTPGQPNYVGGLSHVANSISGHSYFTTSPFATMKSQREQLASAVSQVNGLTYWMSEYCILGDNAGEINGNGRDLSITPALYLARVIHSDLVFANASAWHWWTAISAYDYKDGLVYIDKQKENGNYYESKMLWALGNYSRFIRPGYKRVKISASSGDSQSFLYSAYKDAATGKLVVVAINTGTAAVSFNLNKQNTAVNNVKLYTTSADKDLALSIPEAGKPIEIAPRTIVTITID